jgi:hypothetical protein
MEIEVFSGQESLANRTVAIPEGTGALDEVPWLPESLEKAEAALKYWQGRVNELKAALRVVAGDNESLTLNGREVFTYNHINGFRGADFKKDHPDLYEAYLHTVEKDELDVKTLKSARPDLYKQYQSRQLRRA